MLHVSSVGVYSRPSPGGPLGEGGPLGRSLYRFRDGYARAKILAEGVARAAGSLATVVRPSGIIGPRDRSSLPRLAAAATRGWATVVGRGDNLLNVVAATDAADGMT